MQTYVSGSPAISSNGRIMRTWLLRPVIWFPTAYTIMIIVHEGAHAVTAVALGFPSTLFNFWVNHQFTGVTLGERAIVGAAGPTVSLILGTVCWAIYRRVKHSTAGLPVLFLAAHGVSNFFGNLMSAAFVGDFSNAAIVLGLSSLSATSPRRSVCLASSWFFSLPDANCGNGRHRASADSAVRWA